MKLTELEWRVRQMPHVAEMPAADHEEAVALAAEIFWRAWANIARRIAFFGVYF